MEKFYELCVEISYHPCCFWGKGLVLYSMWYMLKGWIIFQMYLQIMDTLNSSQAWFLAFWITIQLLEFMFILLYYSQGGGESLDQLYDRCTSALERIGGKHQGMVSPFVSRFFTIREFAEPMFNQVLVSLWTEWPHILFTFWDSHEY